MRVVARFVRLTPIERRLVAHAAFLELAATMLLRVVSFGTCRRIVARIAAFARRTDVEEPVDRVAWAVMAAAAHLPLSISCVPQALAAAALLERCGLSADVRVGVSRSRPHGDGSFAHAWVQCGSRTIFTRTSPSYLSLHG